LTRFNVEETQGRIGEKVMNARKATEQSQDSRSQYTDLDHRYGKIGISAVAAALCHQGEQPAETESRFIPADSD
jgi:hypothetical protein